MKLNKQRDKDCYIFLEDGQIVEEEKDKDSLKIMNNDSNSFNKDNCLKDNCLNEANTSQKDFYDNLSQHVSSLPKKKTFNRILISVISIIIILLAFNIFGLLKSVQEDSYNQLNLGLNHFTASEKNKEELFFISDVIHNSNSNIKGYYDELNSLIQNSNNYSFSTDVLKIQKKIQTDLNDINSLREYVTYDNFEKPITILKDRFENVFELCTFLLNKPSSSNIENYNSHAKKEIELQNNLISTLSSYFEKLNIEYKITNDNTLVYSKK